jgi:O-antigen/teichoic acid export membrane protein
MLKNMSLTNAIIISGPQVLFDTLVNVQIASLTGLESFKTVAKIQIWMSIIRGTFTLIGAKCLGVEGCILAHAIASVITYFSLGIRLRNECINRKIPVSISGIKSEIPIIYKFSVPTLMSNLTLAPTNWICRVMLVRLHGGYEQMGIINVCFQWANAMRFIPYRVLAVTLPILSNLFGEKDFIRYYKVYRFTAWAVFGASLIVGTIISIFSKRILTFYGSEFAEGYLVLVITMAQFALQMLSRVQVQVALSRGHAVVDFIASAGRSIIQILVWYYLTNLGALGFVLAIMISYIPVAFALSCYVNNIKKKDILKPKEKGLF